MTDREPDGLPSQYAPAEVEARRYEYWEKAGYFTPEAQENPDAPSFSIVLPPPNVTGSVHIGHALDHTLSDTMVRRRRMQGYRTLWLPGMDHAGIATQFVVERQLDCTWSQGVSAGVVPAFLLPDYCPRRIGLDRNRMRCGRRILAPSLGRACKTQQANAEC